MVRRRLLLARIRPRPSLAGNDFLINARIEAAARSHGAVPVDLYAPFKGAGDVDPTPLLADDGDHPDAAGHALIARVLLAALPTEAG